MLRVIIPHEDIYSGLEIKLVTEVERTVSNEVHSIFLSAIWTCLWLVKFFQKFALYFGFVYLN